MKSIALPVGSPFARIVLITTLAFFSNGHLQVSVAQVTDSNLNLTITRANQNTVLRWFASNAVPYQVESSSTLTAWANSSSVIIGSGSFLFATNPIAGQSNSFYRVKRLPLVAAAFNPATGVLTITGDDLDNTIVVNRDAAGNIRVNNGAVPVTGGTPTVANTVLIQLFGRAGNDQLSLDESNGALPPANMFGEAGNDTLTGGSGADILNGGTGADMLLGRGGADQLFGGDGDDTLTGGDADDQVFGENNNDRFIWNPGDDTDLNEGGAGLDTVEVNGGNGAEIFTTTANGTRVRFDRVSPAPFSLDIGTCENLVLNANGGDDSFSATGNLAALILITVDGGEGNDTILGGNGADILLGGNGNDFVDGNQGNDIALLGAGNDTFQWDPGDGSDTVEGEADSDTLLFNGSAGNEIIDLSINGSRLRLTRDLGNIVMDVAGVETVQPNALGGVDRITINDLSPTEVTNVSVNLSASGGGGDAQLDTVVVNGTAGVDNITATQVGADANITGLTPVVAILAGETNDVIMINALGGNDTINASGITSLFAPTIDGGAGNDTITGSARADILIGGDDADVIAGRQGNDVMLGGNGDDTFIWNPGDANDTMEGQAGTDMLLFTGANINENINASANGARLLFFRDVANVTLDCDDIEKVRLFSLGGADTITLGDLTGTDVSAVLVDLAASGGGGDAQPDSITITGTQTNDTVVVSGSPGTVAVTGLPASVTVTNCEPANDSLILNAQGGLDTVNASTLVTGVIKLSVNGGLGNDILIGSDGNDSFVGGDGNDTILAGGGDDTLVWNPGDDNDIFEGQAGNDTLQFNGASIAENISLSANGTRLLFFRDIANVAMDCNDVETVRFEALGGADTITINDLSATDVTAVNLNLAATLGGNTGDGQPDNIIVNGTGVGDAITVSGAAGSVIVSGLSATVTLTTCEAASDRVTINTLGGDDIMDASALPAGIISLIADGGINNDFLIGSGGADTLFGGDGDDTLIGGPGVDTLDGGPGNNTIIQ